MAGRPPAVLTARAFRTRQVHMPHSARLVSILFIGERLKDIAAMMSLRR